MTKKVLVLYYSQSGQLTEIVDSFLQPFKGHANVSTEVVNVQPLQPYPFPWTSKQFFSTMPDTVLQKPTALQPVQLQSNHYDLVVFAYQPWYLSLSIPALSAIQLPQVQKILNNTPVVTLIGSRNMWISSQQKLKRILDAAGAKLVGNIALVDRAHNLVSVVTILYWMLTGKRDSFLGIFPRPGVSEEDVQRTALFGETVLNSLLNNSFAGLQTALVQQQAVVVNPDLLFVEERAPRLFSIWANFISKRKNRDFWLTVFKYYLLFALFIVAPIVLTLNALIFRPIFRKSLKRKINYYSGLSTTL